MKQVKQLNCNFINLFFKGEGDKLITEFKIEDE